jgi:hypothetical protein
MDILSKLMGGLDLESLQGMMPQIRIIEDYKLVSCEDSVKFEAEVNDLIQQGYEPYGMLIKYQYSSFIREMVKYKAITPLSDVKE